MGLLLAQAGGPGLELGQILAQGGGLGEGLLELGLLRLQLGIRPLLWNRRRWSQVLRRSLASVQDTSSSPEETRAVIRFSSSWLWLTARPVWRKNTERSKTSWLTPVRISPAVSPVRPGTARPVSW